KYALGSVCRTESKAPSLEREKAKSTEHKAVAICFRKFAYMPKSSPIAQDFLIDKLTNSIENLATGEIFDTEVTLISASNKAQIKKEDWQFDWQKEFKDKTKLVFKLTTV